MCVCVCLQHKQLPRGSYVQFHQLSLLLSLHNDIKRVYKKKTSLLYTTPQHPKNLAIFVTPMFGLPRWRKP